MNKTQIVNNELSEITTHRAFAELKARENLRLAREIPEFCSLDNDARKITIELTKTADPQKVKSLRTELEKLRKKQEKVLSDYHISPDSLAPQYSCKMCQDTGYIDGKMCACLAKKVQFALTHQSGLDERLKFSFETSDPKIVDDNESLKKAYTVAKKYVETFPNFQYPNLVFVGNVGAGKTYLIECIANALIQKSCYVVFSTAFDLNRTIQNSFGLGTLEREAMLAPFFESDLLIIDDLGSEPLIKNVTISNLFSVINERQSHNLPMIISTNLDLDEIQERYGDRVASRIFNKRFNLIIPFLGKDLRVN